MPEQAGPSIAALRAQQAALADHHGAVADADRALAAALADAHAATRQSVSRLDEIAVEIERAVADHPALAVDTAMGAREFHRFLTAKQREIAAIVAHARELDRLKSAALEVLRAQYSGSSA